jgi:hypothetical protein
VTPKQSQIPVFLPLSIAMRNLNSPSSAGDGKGAGG